MLEHQDIYDHPVDYISEEDRDRTPEDGLALCLSGGGYRAMLFHLGSLWRLNDLHYLPRLDRVSSVSGGSITAGVLGMNWETSSSMTTAAPPGSRRRSSPPFAAWPATPSTPRPS